MNRKSAVYTAPAAAALIALSLFVTVEPARADFRVVFDTNLLDLVFDDFRAATTVSWSHTTHHPDRYSPPVSIEYCGGTNGPVRYHEELHGYGEWVFYAEFGEGVWFPYVDPDWRPYLHGHWINTSRGMTWVAYEPWGWIPHHYGRWIYFEGAGWGWVPGYEYGPAWVSWSVVDGHVGWAPLPPHGYRYPNWRRYDYAGDHWRYGYHGWSVYPDCGIDFNFWIFVENNYFYNTSIYVHVLPPHHSSGFWRSRRVLPVGSHLDVSYVKRISPRRVVNTTLHRTTHRFRDRDVVHYRPLGQKDRIREGRAIARKAGHITERGDRSLVRGRDDGAEDR